MLLIFASLRFVSRGSCIACLSMTLQREQLLWRWTKWTCRREVREHPSHSWTWRAIIHSMYLRNHKLELEFVVAS